VNELTDHYEMQDAKLQATVDENQATFINNYRDAEHDG
jgi:hypothetical protein